MKPLLLLLAASLAAGCAKHQISGTVVDRNGQPLERVVVSMKPGGVQMITDAQGVFMVDYLRDERGQRMRLDRKAQYTVEVLKPGYNRQKVEFYYKRGELVLDPITMEEDTIRVSASDEDIDPARFKDRTQSEGSTYEGE